MVYYSEDYLCHYGIKGQKWGLRRFQKPNGTLTPEGRERYSNASIKDYYNTNKKLVATAQGAGGYIEKEKRDREEALADALEHIRFYEKEMNNPNISQKTRNEYRNMRALWKRRYESLIYNERDAINKDRRSLEGKYGITINDKLKRFDGEVSTSVSSDHMSNMGQLVRGVKYRNKRQDANNKKIEKENKRIKEENSTMNKIKKKVKKVKKEVDKFINEVKNLF